jgi:[acyl-carrier-protein] S-malonyltransferase
MKLDPKSTAFVFPGQGSQEVGMGHDLAINFPIAKQTFEQADELLDFPLSRLMWDGPESDLNDTVNTQPALYIHSVAAHRVFTHQYSGFKPATVAGHSLGELSALTASGALPFEDGLRLVRTRGKLMKRASEENPGGMAAILGLDIPTLEKVCTDACTADEIVQVANDNCPGQVVISGAKAAVERAIEGAKAAGAKRGIPLAVSIAAHSPLMNSIQNEWDAAVDACSMDDPSIPVVGNVHAQPMTKAEELRADIKAQMDSRVRWIESVEGMLKSGVQTFVEVGSGSVLIGLIRRISKSTASESLISCYQLGNQEDSTQFVTENSI